MTCVLLVSMPNFILSAAYSHQNKIVDKRSNVRQDTKGFVHGSLHEQYSMPVYRRRLPTLDVLLHQE